jgi:putative ABC transport system permease protein
VVRRASGQSESDGAITPEAAAIVTSLPGVARDASGAPRVAPQFLAYTKLRRADGQVASVLMRGITPAVWDVLGDTAPRIDGKSFSVAANECVAGVAAMRGYPILTPDAQIKVRNTMWRVTGALHADGLWGSELWADIGSLQAAFNASTAPSALWVKLQSPAAFADFDKALRADPRLKDVRAERQRDYYTRQVFLVVHFAHLAALGIAATLGLGAVLAIANSLSLALIARRRELAVLRALGFSRIPLALALLLEVELIGLLATAVVIALLRYALDGLQVGTSTGTQAIDFTLAITPDVMGAALAYALLLASAAALWPARQAVRETPVAALGGE